MTRVIKGFCSASADDQILLIYKPFLDSLPFVMSTVSVGVRDIYAALDEVIPAKDFFAP